MSGDLEHGAASHFPKELEVLVGAGRASAEELLLVGSPTADGRVMVRGWTGSDWSSTPTSRERDARELLLELERAVRNGRSVRPELGRIRDWLNAR